MVVFDRAAAALSCPECGGSDVERKGWILARNRYYCVEGHQFEVPRRPVWFARWRNKTTKTR